ncbi:MAG: hypothetical protein PHC53_05850 [Patescibacteria group bacterium]|nr:hypothetical protein [Patescibacteria group bacterium]
MNKQSEEAPSSAPKPLNYKVICISIYNDDLANLDEVVAQLKARGATRVSRSMLIRYALGMVNINSAFQALSTV